jgi:hypothetical protein
MTNQNTPSNIQEPHLKRFSGLRLLSPYQAQSLEIMQLAAEINALCNGKQLQDMPNFVDDSYRGFADWLFWCRVIQQGEAMAIHDQKGGSVIGVAIIDEIRLGVSARLNFIAASSLFMVAGFELLKYIFNDLECKKVKLLVHPENVMLVDFAQKVGFKALLLPVESSFYGRLTGMLHMELLNPALFSKGEDLHGSANDSIRDTDATSESTNGDESRRVCAELRGGAVSTVDEHDGNAVIESVSVGDDTDGEIGRILQSNDVGNTGLPATGRRQSVSGRVEQPAKRNGSTKSIRNTNDTSGARRR